MNGPLHGFGVGMYLRTTQRHNRDGSAVRYLQLARNRRVDGVTRAQVLVNLGREDRLDREALARLAASIDRYLDGGGPAASRLDAADVAVRGARSSGAVWLLDSLWHELGVDTALRAVLGRRLSGRGERALFALVAHAALARGDEPSVVRWVATDVDVPGLPVLDDRTVLRVRDRLLRADERSRLQDAVFLRAADLLHLDTDLLFTTVVPAAHRRPEVHLAVGGEGTPAAVWACTSSRAGGCHRSPALLRSGGRVVSVRDGHRDERDGPDPHGAAPGSWLAALSPAAPDPRVAAALARPGRYRDVDVDLRVKEVRLPGGPGVRWIVCHDLVEAERRAGQGRRAGRYVLHTNALDVPAADLALGHRDLLAARRTFLDLGPPEQEEPGMEGPLGQPDAQLVLRGLALLLVRVAERRSGLAWRRVAHELGRVQAVTITGRQGTVVRTTALTREQAAILHRCGVPAPPAAPPGPRT